MIQIDDKLISLDVVEKFFCCDINSCLGQCCIDGDAGAPITEEEKKKIEELLPQLRQYLSPQALEIIDKQGVSYIDEDGDLVTSIVNGQDCVFTTYAPGGLCLCAIEKLYREGKTDFKKPISCHLYPIRATEYSTFTALNYHRWKICKPACALGKKLNMRVYEALKEPLIRAYGERWYEELELTAKEYLKSQNNK